MDDVCAELNTKDLRPACGSFICAIHSLMVRCTTLVNVMLKSPARIHREVKDILCPKVKPLNERYFQNFHLNFFVETRSKRSSYRYLKTCLEGIFRLVITVCWLLCCLFLQAKLSTRHNSYKNCIWICAVKAYHTKSFFIFFVCDFKICCYTDYQFSCTGSLINWKLNILIKCQLHS